ncbi:MAG: hypothetical protein WAO12_06165 [Venatoribacter sp.]
MESNKTFNKLWLAALLAGFLVGCSGGDGLFEQPGEDGNDNTNTGTSNATFYPLNFYQVGKEYGFEKGGVVSHASDEMVEALLIAPVDAKTLEPLAAPSIDDYSLTINDEPISKDENGLRMQKVLGLPVQHTVALVIDTSASSQSIDKDALVNAIKAYVDAASNSSDPVINTQKYTLWVFGDDVVSLDGNGNVIANNALTPGNILTASDVLTANGVETALDSINWTAQGGYSALYHAIVRAVGVYKGKGSVELKDDVDYSSDTRLSEGYEYGGTKKRDLKKLNLSSVVLFASGGDTLTYFSQDAAKSALTWQHLKTYKPVAEQNPTDDDSKDDTTAAGDSKQKYDLLGKPLFYVALGTNSPISKIKELATATIETNSTDQFNFAQTLIEKQGTVLRAKARLDNMYLVQFSVPLCDGKTNMVKLESTSATNGYALKGELDFSKATTPCGPTANPYPAPYLEITGPNDAYLAGDKISFAATGTKLYPATRWDVWGGITDSYRWTVGGATRAANSDGSINISADDIGKTIKLSRTGVAETQRDLDD